MKEKVASWEPQIRSVMRMVMAYMILLHGLREVFGLMAPRGAAARRPMPLDRLGEPGGIVLLVLGTLLFVGFMVRPAALILALQSAFAYLYVAQPRAPLPIRNGGQETLIYFFILLYLAAAGAGARRQHGPHGGG